MNFPKVSFIIPTFNAEKYISNCLKSIEKQDYPKNKTEVFIIDGGSTDKTVKIAKEFHVKILENPNRDAESGKAIGIKKAGGDIIALIDADNELVEKNWLSEMIIPFVEENTIFGVESPWYIRKKDPLINQYVTLLRIADPLARRLHPVMKVEDKGRYLVYKLKMGQTPVVGANGFLWRKKFIKIIGNYKEKFEEVNYVAVLINKGYFSYARTKNVGIYHYYCTSLHNYIRKRLKIGRKFMIRKEKGQNTWVDQSRGNSFFWAVLYNLSIVLPLFEAVREYRKSKNIAWVWHPIISFLTIFVYGFTYLEAKMKHKIKDV